MDQDPSPNPVSPEAPITKGQFRWLLTASIIATILGIIVAFAAQSSLPQPLRDYLASETDPALRRHEWTLFCNTHLQTD